MIQNSKIKISLFIGIGVTVAGIVLRLSARSLASTQMGSGWSSIDQDAEMQLFQDARIIMLFGFALILLACHRWLWMPEQVSEQLSEQAEDQPSTDQ